MVHSNIKTVRLKKLEFFVNLHRNEYRLVFTWKTLQYKRNFLSSQNGFLLFLFISINSYFQRVFRMLKLVFFLDFLIFRVYRIFAIPLIFNMYFQRVFYLLKLVLKKLLQSIYRVFALLYKCPFFWGKKNLLINYSLTDKLFSCHVVNRQKNVTLSKNSTFSKL